VIRKVDGRMFLEGFSHAAARRRSGAA